MGHAPRAAAATIDGRIDFSPAPPWTPLLNVDWGGGTARAEAWFRTAWTGGGLHLSVALPLASAADRMPTGRTPAAPFVLHFAIDGGAGQYEIRCVPLVGPVTRMTTRDHGYLFNSRLGANARIGEAGHALCQEVSLLGILADSLQTRWGTPASGGLAFEALVPWSTLRLPTPVPGVELPFRIRVTRPEQRTGHWASASAMGRLRLGHPGGGAGSGGEGEYLLVRAGALRQPEPLVGAFSMAGARAGAAAELAVVAPSGEVRRRSTAAPSGDAFFGTLDTRGLTDGRYTLRATYAGRTLGERPVDLLGEGALAQVDEPAAAIASRLDRLTASAGAVWRTGHLARARTLLRLAALPAGFAPGDYDRSRKLLADAGAIVDALESGRRPDPAAEGYGHAAGFAADGARGPVTFIPATGPGARLTVNAQREAGYSLTPLLYGTFSEPVVYDRPIYSMLHAEALRNSSFEFGHPSVEETVRAFIGYQELEPDAARAALDGVWLPRLEASIEEVAAPWFAVGQGSVRFQTRCPGAYNDRACQRITADAGARGAGVAQLITLPAWRETRYRLRGFTRSDGRVRSARVVLHHAGRIVATLPLRARSGGWAEFEGVMEIPRVEGPLNTFLLAIVFDGPGRLDLDLVTLYPMDAVDGFDPQAVEQLRALNTGWIRWPGGNLASAYRWRDGVGPQDRRPTLPNPSWPGLSPNFVGTDEYLRLSERIGTEPLITVNAGDGSAEEAARWVEYVNGDSTTAMGRLRAKNGRAKPYGVRYWNIGNELWGHWQVGYTNPEEHARRYSAFARAMRAVDPSIRVVANGHGGHSESPPERWNQPLLEKFGGELDLIDVHTYVDVPAQEGLTPADRAFLLSAIPLSYEQWLSEFREDLVRRGLEKVRVIVGEYNGSIRSESREINRLGDLLIYAGYLHAFIRQGEYVVGANATEYSPMNPRALQFGRMHPRYELFRTYAARAGTRPVEAVLETPVRQQERRVGRDVLPIFNLPLVDAVALKDSADGSLAISLINRDMEDRIPVEIRLEGIRPRTEGRWFLFGAGFASEVVESALPTEESFTVTLPAHSVSLLKVYPVAAVAP